jgi:inward rectifier potassium channel
MLAKKQIPLSAIDGTPRPRTLNLEPESLFTDFYLSLLTCSWPMLLLQIAGAFFAVNALFAVGYQIDRGIENAHSFADYYFFSVETMATVGYGKLVPATLVSHILMSIEALFGLVGLALVTGLVFAKFSRPTARVRFSHYAVISPFDGVPSLMFRMANVRTNQIVEAQMHVVFSRIERTVEGQQMRRFYDLQLVRNRNAIFAYSWTAIHQIVPGSPLYGATPKSLADSNAWIVVSVTGLDETFAQTVHARKYYISDELRWGARLVDIVVQGEDGNSIMDFANFDEIEPAEAPPWTSATVRAVAEP